jgi:hypothetical protein
LVLSKGKEEEKKRAEPAQCIVIIIKKIQEANLVLVALYNSFNDCLSDINKLHISKEVF